MKNISLNVLLISLFFVLALLPLGSGMMEPDGALYAVIAKNMVLNGHWSELIFRGTDWLDKPHMQFWITAMSFKIFGINAFAYKLPSILVWYVGVYYVYLLAKYFGNKSIALLSVLIYMSATHVLISNFDVRAEAYVSTFSTAALYHLIQVSKQKYTLHIVWAALFSAMAIMTKGIFVCVPIAIGIIWYEILNKNFASLFRAKYILVMLLTSIGILPELYSLYLQFDVHPEKIIFDKNGISGIRFFFWDSQFGRFFNSGPIKGKGDVSFFLHTTLWAFLPWSAMLYFAVANALKRLKTIQVQQPIHVLYGSAAFTFLLFSFSSFQLPHYLLILFPHFSIFTARYFTQNQLLHQRWLITQKIVTSISILLLIFIAYFFEWKWWFIPIAVGIGLATFISPLKNTSSRLLFVNAMQAVAVSIFLYVFFYPNLLKFQSGEQAGKWLQKHLPNSTSYFYKTYAYSYDFYAQGMPQNIENIQNLHPGNCVYTNAEGLKELQQKKILTILQEYPDFHITKLTKAFINPNTRLSVCEKRYLIQIEK